MLTSVGRTAARRVVASANLNLNLPSVLASRSPLVLRPAAARSFSLSRWNPLAAKTGSATTKKSATKKGSAASAEKKAAPKKKMAAKAKKAAPKKKAKKVLTPEEQYKLKVKELKKTALLKEQPDNLPNNAWALYVAETVPGEISKHSGMSDMLRSIKANYDNLSSSEKQVRASQT